ncbi:MULTISPECIES: LPP20 family lipoprotein [Shewanella]|uniref:Flagellar biosynthesis protein FlgP n=1 Tax=Shewanella polaris TaxID=2588449 RepID=A0A4Y5YH47_9GAMM|nr:MULTISPECIES: LPP20 family lipoprotein [Shewanella]MBB1382606.1 LPP20 family lipoprotein [Shewanella sp. SR41-2]QDE32024.1 flagellar biosynthesis protein FlgP [Shewanella polaris]
MKSLILIMLLVLSGCVSKDKYVQWETEAPASFPTLTAIGYAPLATQPSKEASHRILMAMQASKIAAYRELAEQVYGQKVTANSDVSEWLLTDDNVKSSVSGIIRGAKVVKTYPSGEFYVTELALDFKQVWQLYEQQNRPKRVKDVTYF